MRAGVRTNSMSRRVQLANLHFTHKTGLSDPIGRDKKMALPVESAKFFSNDRCAADPAIVKSDRKWGGLL